MLQRTDHLKCDLVIIAYNPIHQHSVSHHLSELLIRVQCTILRVKPDNLVRIVCDPRLGERPGVTLVAVLPLHVICLEHTGDLPVPLLNQVLRKQKATRTVVHQHLRTILHLLITSLNKYIRNLKLLKLLKQPGMSAVDLTLARLNNNAVNILLQKLL